MSELRQLLAELTPDQRAQLERRLMQMSAARGTERIPRRPTFSPCPLSFAQQRLWFLHQLEPLSPFYNVPKALRLVGSLDVPALQRTLDSIVARHEVLRTTYEAVDGRPMQMIAADRPAEMAVIDLSTWSAAERDAATERFLKDAVQRPFDLSREVMLRATLLRLSAQEHILLLNMHHIASDRWSTGILLRELSARYTAFSRGEPSPLPELPIQYADFAVWQHEWLQGEVLKTQLAYWKAHLEGAPPVLALPTDRPRPSVPTYRGGQVSFWLPKPLTTALKALSDRQGATLFMTLLAAFKALLHRYTAQDRIVVGTPIANRRRVEVEGLIGFFVNTLVLHTDLSGNPSFHELLARVRQVALGAYAHQDLPFERLVEAIQPERTLSYHPVIQVMFNYRSDPEDAGAWPDLAVSLLPRENDSQPFDLLLAIADEPAGLKGSLSYSSDLFDAPTMQRLAGHYHTLLEGVIAHPDQPIATLPLIPASERQQLLVAWNATQRVYPQDVCLQQLFEAQVERTPEAVAVVFEGRLLTYRELNRHANQLAHHLKKLGVGADLPVGICVERSLEMVAGLLGILKAGGAYLPLDPAYPRERLAFMLKDAQAAVLVTERRFREDFPEYRGKVVCLDADREAIARESEANVVSTVMAQNLAYVIYTSGSTGRPKGVEIQHAGVVNLVEWHRRVYGVIPADRATHLAGLAFDASVWELWPYLVAGASVHLADQETRTSPDKLVAWLTTRGITLCFLPTPLAEAVLDAPWPAGVSLRALLTGGDWLHRGPRNTLPFPLTNHYGPTEYTVVTTWAPVAAETASDTAPSIGRPIDNTQVYLLASDLQPVPLGVLGELYIGGGGLARGYRGRPELTAERFIPHPFSDEPGARLYKTGDLARYRPDGMLEFLGRLDGQVKIRGYRVELGEIEAVLTQHPAVRESVVVAREEVPGERRLVAYVVADRQPGPSIRDLRRFLRAELPDYMVPAAVVPLETLPLTPNGKVDRRQLPAPEPARPALEDALVAPRTPVEEGLAEIWGQVLAVEQVGIHDNFFELGGHSLLATQVIARLQAAFQVELPLRRLFEAPTVADLAKYIETVRWAAQDRQAPLGAPVGDREEEAL
jgi:amino acid adenylation domain-containing protein